MNLLREIHDSDIFPGIQDTDPSNFSERRAARAVVLNKFGQIALLRVSNRNFHKLPGGGIEGDEAIEEALRREAREEIGCDIWIEDEVGTIIEYKNQQKQKQTSYCYVAEQVGDAKAPAFTDSELEDGFEIVWTDTIDEAIDLLENDHLTDYAAHFIQARDLTFLKEAKQILE